MSAQLSDNFIFRADLKCVFLDTAGHGAPLRKPQAINQHTTTPTEFNDDDNNKQESNENNNNNNNSTSMRFNDPRKEALLRKKISEDILKELAFEMSDVIIVVLNELAWSDQVITIPVEKYNEKRETYRKKLI